MGQTVLSYSTKTESINIYSTIDQVTKDIN